MPLRSRHWNIGLSDRDLGTSAYVSVEDVINKPPALEVTRIELPGVLLACRLGNLKVPLYSLFIRRITLNLACNLFIYKRDIDNVFVCTVVYYYY